MAGVGVSRQPGFRLLVAALALSLAGCASASGVSETQRLHARAAYERGLAAMGARQGAQALTAFQEAIALDASVPVYRNMLGLLYLQLRRPDLAIEQLRQAVAIDPSYAEGHLNYGVALAETQRWEEAVVEYRRALALPTLASPHLAHQNLGVALYNLKRYQEAEQELTFAIGLSPRMEGAYYNLGLVLTAEGRKDEARKAFLHARDLDPKSPFGRAAVERLRDLGGGG